MNYAYITRKQANIIYSAVKRGELNASKKFINKLYDSVERTDSDMYLRVNDIIDWIFKKNFDFAQAIIDGSLIEKKTVEIVDGYRIATDHEDNPFLIAGEKVEITHFEVKYTFIENYYND